MLFFFALVFPFPPCIPTTTAFFCFLLALRNASPSGCFACAQLDASLALLFIEKLLRNMMIIFMLVFVRIVMLGLMLVIMLIIMLDKLLAL